MLQPILDLVVKVTAVYALSAFALAWNFIIAVKLTRITGQPPSQVLIGATIYEIEENVCRCRTCWITRLSHETLDVPVKFAAVVVSGSGERDEILGGLGALLAVQFQLKVTHVAMERHRHDDTVKY